MLGFRTSKSFGVFCGPELAAAGLKSPTIESAFCFEGSLRGSGDCVNLRYAY